MNENLNPAQFSLQYGYTGPEEHGGRYGIHEIAAHDESGSKIGHLRWSGANTGRILDVQVDREHRRQGIATAMWNHAQESGVRPAPKHSNDRTQAGEAWARAVGGRLPRSKQGW